MAVAALTVPLASPSLPMNAMAGGKTATDIHAKARANAVDFEAVFLNSMFSQMFTAIEGEGPFGGGNMAPACGAPS